MLSFDFNNKNSYEDFGVLVKTRPSIPLPERNVTYIEIPGRDGSLTEDDDTYKNITISVDCFIFDENYLSERIEDIKGWLTRVKSDLVFSHKPNIKYIGQVVNSMEIMETLKVVNEFTITFNCEPYNYPVFNPLIEVEEQDTKIDNIFTRVSKPTITIFGTGNITLNIKDYWGEIQTVSFTSVDDHITIDSALMECYKDDTLCNDKMIGDFPVLGLGENYISWTGNVQKIEILTNFRSV